MRAQKRPYMVDEPEQHIVGLRDTRWKAAGPFLSHKNPPSDTMPHGESLRTKTRGKGNKGKGKRLLLSVLGTAKPYIVPLTYGYNPVPICGPDFVRSISVPGATAEHPRLPT